MDYRTPKCTHNQKGMCIHCMVKKSKAQKSNNNIIQQKNQLIIKCKHPVHMKCLKCLPMNQKTNNLCNHPDYQQCKHCQHMIKYQTFQQYIQKLNFDCKHKKPCSRCVPPLSRRTYFIDKTCKKHVPYPQAQCDSCMAPTITIQKQIYAHVTKVKIQTLAVLKLVETKLFGILLGNQKNGIVQVQDIYFPQDQDQKSGYISPQTLGSCRQIFSYLNLKQVGIAYSSSQITSMGLMISSIFQQYFLQFQKQNQISKFVTMRLQFDEQANLEPHFQCFMVSDQFQAFHKNNIIYQKYKEVNYFDLITVKNDKMSEMPTFLREGVQTQIIYFRQIVTWIPTVFEQHLTIEDPNMVYPFFRVDAQTIQKFKIFISVFHEQPWQKYRNIQFLMHMCKLFGIQNVLIFLQQFLMDNPQLFLKQKIKQYETIQRGRIKQLQNPNIYDQYKNY